MYEHFCLHPLVRHALRNLIIAAIIIVTQVIIEISALSLVENFVISGYTPNEVIITLKH